MKKFISIVLALAMIFAFAACAKEAPKADVPANESKDYSFSFTIVNDNGKFAVKDKDQTKATDIDYALDGHTVGEVLAAAGVIAGDTSEYGLYVKTVSGITLDYDADGYWWQFNIGEDMAQTAVDQTPIKDGEVYTFIAAKS